MIPMEFTEAQIERAAEAIYMTHWRGGAPYWSHVSAAVREYVRAQAIAALTAIAKARPGLLQR